MTTDFYAYKYSTKCVFGLMMPSSAFVIILANIPFLGAVIYNFHKLHEHNKMLQ